MISKLTVYKQALLMAQLSDLAYNDNQLFNDLGFDSIFLSKNGTQAYFLWNAADAIIVCRGTQPTEWADIKADLELNLVPSNSGHGLVHHGLNTVLI
jgi:triacylglycerol lipase